MSRPKINAQAKIWLVKRIEYYRKKYGATYEETAQIMNEKEDELTIQKQKWTTNYMIRFYHANKHLK